MYLDPGFGSMVFQVIVALIAACSAYLVIIRKKVVAFFGVKNRHDETPMNDSLRENDK